MAAQRVAMRNIKECLRLKFKAGLSHEKIAQALQLSKGVVSKYVTAASETGLEWSARAVLGEVALAAALLPAAKVRHTHGERVLLSTVNCGARASPCNGCGKSTSPPIPSSRPTAIRSSSNTTAATPAPSTARYANSTWPARRYSSTTPARRCR